MILYNRGSCHSNPSLVPWHRVMQKMSAIPYQRSTNTLCTLSSILFFPLLPIVYTPPSFLSFLLYIPHLFPLLPPPLPCYIVAILSLLRIPFKDTILCAPCTWKIRSTKQTHSLTIPYPGRGKGLGLVSLVHGVEILSVDVRLQFRYNWSVVLSDCVPCPGGRLKESVFLRLLRTSCS